jgi:hypothetical protein
MIPCIVEQLLKSSSPPLLRWSAAALCSTATDPPPFDEQATGTLPSSISCCGMILTPSPSWRTSRSRPRPSPPGAVVAPPRERPVSSALPPPPCYIESPHKPPCSVGALCGGEAHRENLLAVEPPVTPRLHAVRALAMLALRRAGSAQ